MSNIVIILSPLMKAEDVKAKLETTLAGKTIEITDNLFSTADVTLVPYHTGLNRTLSNTATLNDLLEQKQLLVQTHLQTTVGNFVAEFLADESVDEAQASRISTNAFGAIGFANQIAKINEGFVVTTELDYNFGEDVAIKEWFEQSAREEALAAEKETKTTQAITKDIPEFLEKVNTISSEIAETQQVAETDIPLAIPVDKVEEVALETKQQLMLDGAQPEVVTVGLSTDPTLNKEAEQIENIKDQYESIAARVDEVDQVKMKVEIQPDPTNEAAAFSISREPTEEELKAASERLLNDVRTNPSPDTGYTIVATKQDGDTVANTDTKQTDSFDSFDPLAAFNGSLKKSQEIETEQQMKPEQKEKQDSKRIGKLPEYPNVSVSVEIKTPVLTEKTEPVPEDEPRLFDWAGAPEVLTAILRTVDDKVEEAEVRRRRPNLTDQDIKAMACMEDRLGSTHTLHRMFVDGAKWSQALTTETKQIPIITIIKNPNYGDHRYVGPDAVSLISNRMKIGVSVGVFLPHTGLYFLIISPSDQEVLDTLSIIQTQRVDMLKSSSGILLGNSNHYLNKQIIDLFLNNVTDCSLVSFNRETIYGLIDDRDVDIIATALKASICPDGYLYQQVCGLELEGKDGVVCDEAVDFVLDLRRMVFADNSRLNEYQRNIATSGLVKRTLKEIEEYQAQLFLGWTKSYEITEGIEFVYGPAKAVQQIEAGEKWIAEISKVVDRIVAFKQDEAERNTMIEQRVNLARMREFTHWIKDIIVDGMPLQDEAKKNQLLDRLGRNPEVVSKVGETLAQFQRQSVIAMPAIPRVKCKGCQNTDKRDYDISPYLIPQDAASRFFTLALQRLS